MIKIQADRLEQVANRWLSTPGLSWADLARTIDPNIRGHNLSRLCAYKGLVKKPAKSYRRCQNCKKIKSVSEFCSGSERPRYCNSCRDYFSKRKGSLRRLTDDELAQFWSAWDVQASNNAMKLWSAACPKIKKS